MKRVGVVTFQDNKIVMMVYSGIEMDEVDALLREARSIIERMEPRSVLMLSDFTDAHYNAAVINKMKAFSTSITPFVHSSVLVGVTGLKKIIAGGIMRVTGRTLHLCDTREEAKNWLVSQ